MADLAKQLADMSYHDLFLRMDSATLNSLWNAPGGPEALLALATDPGAPDHARFLASEILFRKQSDFNPGQAAGPLATAYAAELRQADVANPWGMPGKLDGPPGQHLVALGEPAVAALVPLLHDDSPILYEGSKEATVGNSYDYRVKDFAAFFLSRIRHTPYDVRQTPADRDPLIEKLRAAIG
jgi:hypothetical protein